jgi:hypothetical protein
MELSLQTLPENTTANPDTFDIKSLLENLVKCAVALAVVYVVAEAVEKSPTLPYYICRKLYQEKCRKILETFALSVPSATDDNAVAEFPRALLSWLATIASDYWLELSCVNVSCGCAAAAFERRSARTEVNPWTETQS